MISLSHKLVNFGAPVHPPDRTRTSPAPEPPPQTPCTTPEKDRVAPPLSGQDIVCAFFDALIVGGIVFFSSIPLSNTPTDLVASLPIAGTSALVTLGLNFFVSLRKMMSMR